jgi:mRNA-degrading endonuclease YafQ of YafQ-DinJ toxin-antitoxin module
MQPLQRNILLTNLSHKTRFLAADLKKWQAKKPKTSDQLHSIEAQILAEQNLHPSNQNHTLQHHLHQQHQNLMVPEEAYHIKIVKKQWALKGDRNTEYFYLAIIKRNMKNKITHLLNPDGSQSTTPSQLSSTLTSYFQSIFTSSSSPSQSIHSTPLPRQSSSPSTPTPQQPSP